MPEKEEIDRVRDALKESPEMLQVRDDILQKLPSAERRHDSLMFIAGFKAGHGCPIGPGDEGFEAYMDLMFADAMHHVAISDAILNEADDA